MKKVRASLLGVNPKYVLNLFAKLVSRPTLLAVWWGGCKFLPSPLTVYEPQHSRCSKATWGWRYTVYTVHILPVSNRNMPTWQIV